MLFTNQESESFSAKTSRWIREAIAALRSENFRLTLQIAHMSRAPTERARCLLQKMAKEFECIGTEE